MKSNASSPAGAAAIMAALLLFPSIPGRAESPKQPITLTSPGFPSEGMIPSKYTCEGGNVSPPLEWTGLPAGTKSLALICDDPDAPSGAWVHWVIYNLPANTTALPEKISASATLSNGARQGANDFEKLGYGGPCPPPGKPHHYFFKLYALDFSVPLKPGATKKDLLQAMDHHILGEGMLMGKYQRKK